MVSGRAAGTVSIDRLAAGVGLEDAQLQLASLGRYLPTGSARSSLPSSCSIMIATDTIGLVMDAIEKMASRGIGALLAGST